MVIYGSVYWISIILIHRYRDGNIGQKKLQKHSEKTQSHDIQQWVQSAGPVAHRQ